MNISRLSAGWHHLSVVALCVCYVFAGSNKCILMPENISHRDPKKRDQRALLSAPDGTKTPFRVNFILSIVSYANIGRSNVAIRSSSVSPMIEDFDSSVVPLLRRQYELPLDLYIEIFNQ